MSRPGLNPSHRSWMLYTLSYGAHLVMCPIDEMSNMSSSSLLCFPLFSNNICVKKERFDQIVFFSEKNRGKYISFISILVKEKWSKSVRSGEGTGKSQKISRDVIYERYFTRNLGKIITRKANWRLLRDVVYENYFSSQYIGGKLNRNIGIQIQPPPSKNRNVYVVNRYSVL